MGKIKIHELAKELGLPSKEVLEQAKKIGIEVSSHLSNIEDKQAEQIKNAFSKTTKNKKDNIKVKENKVGNKKEVKKDAPVIISILQSTGSVLVDFHIVWYISQLVIIFMSQASC